MNSKEKLIEVMKDKSFIETYLDSRAIERLTDDILKAFPQIEKKPVKIEVYKYNTPRGKEEYGIRLLQGFETEFQRMQWIEEHDVEVYQ